MSSTFFVFCRFRFKIKFTISCLINIIFAAFLSATLIFYLPETAQKWNIFDYSTIKLKEFCEDFLRHIFGILFACIFVQIISLIVSFCNKDPWQYLSFCWLQGISIILHLAIFRAITLVPIEKYTVLENLIRAINIDNFAVTVAIWIITIVLEIVLLSLNMFFLIASYGCHHWICYEIEFYKKRVDEIFVEEQEKIRVIMDGLVCFIFL
uniref:Uncharacterized protein n=1 Tax=Panagrolaimus superbus TaxID=310955 RepID=A0A914YD56_9BILA